MQPFCFHFMLHGLRPYFVRAVCPLHPELQSYFSVWLPGRAVIVGVHTIFISLKRRDNVLQGAERDEIHSTLFRAGVGLLANKHLIWASSFYCCCSRLLFQQSRQKKFQRNSLELEEHEVIGYWSFGLNKVISILWELQCFQVRSEVMETSDFFLTEDCDFFFFPLSAFLMSAAYYDFCNKYSGAILDLLEQSPWLMLH